MPVFHRGPPVRAALSVAVGLAAAMCAAPAAAAPDEIEVYQSEHQEPGRFGLSVNANYVPDGARSPAYPRAQASQGAYRLTPELAYGLTSKVELGMLTAAAIDRDGTAAVGAVKARVRYIDAGDGRDWYWGANLEVGHSSRRFEEEPWNGELRLIWGREAGRWSFAVNPILSWSMTGAQAATVELASKASYRLQDRLALGVESFNDLGEMRRPGHLREQEQMLYATLDADLGKTALNLGLGRGLTDASDGWVLKAVVDIDFR